MAFKLKWTKFDSNDVFYRFHSNEETGYVLQWTDLKAMYVETIEPSEICERWSILNKAIEVPELSAKLEAIENGLKEAREVKHNTQSGTLTISFVDTELEVLTNWIFECCKATSKVFSKAFVQEPILVSSYHLSVIVSIGLISTLTCYSIHKQLHLCLLHASVSELIYISVNLIW